ncbi:MAG TPA: diguanylate cyclase [Actinomycetota bacterium]|nr:diguanylate cyclase [Actinomycetota bacterium]
MSLRSKLLAVAAVPVAVLLVAVVLAVFAQSAAARANDEVDRAAAMRIALANVEEDLSSAESAVRAFLLTRREAFLGEGTAAIAALEKDLASLTALVKAPVQHVRMDRMQELVEERVRTLGEVERLAGALSPEQQQRLDTWLLHGATVSASIRGLILQMEIDGAAAARASIEARDDAYHRSYLVQMIAMPAALAIAMLALLGFAAAIVRRIGVMRQNAEQLDAGLVTKQQDRSKDELGQLSRAYARTGAHLIELQDELRRLATIDPLTGLANRRGFFALAEHMLLVAARTRCEVALLFVDTDGLKRVNDELGHSVGDSLLMEAADVIRETIRSSDVAGRIGGDEFCVLLVGDPELDADRVVRRLRETEAAHNARPRRTFKVSMSIGLTTLAAGRSVTLEELIDAADEGMYQDKRDRQETQAVGSA